MCAIKKIAAFDFDGTLTYRDSLIPFLRRAVGVGGLARALAASSPALLRYALGSESNGAAKERLVCSALRGRHRAALCGLAADWGRDIRMRPELLERLEWHQDAGHYCVMVSASLDVYLEEIAGRLGFQALVCTRLAVDAGGRLTGRFSTPNCWGGEKVRRLTEQLGPLDQLELYAYGDSAGDMPMLQAARHAWLRGRPMASEPGERLRS